MFPVVHVSNVMVAQHLPSVWIVQRSIADQEACLFGLGLGRVEGGTEPDAIDVGRGPKEGIDGEGGKVHGVVTRDLVARMA